MKVDVCVCACACRARMLLQMTEKIAFESYKLHALSICKFLKIFTVKWPLCAVRYYFIHVHIYLSDC